MVQCLPVGNGNRTQVEMEVLLETASASISSRLPVSGLGGGLGALAPVASPLCWLATAGWTTYSQIPANKSKPASSFTSWLESGLSSLALMLGTASAAHTIRADTASMSTFCFSGTIKGG